MLRIPCPHCGPRDHTEFSYGGDASRPRPDTTGEVDDATWDEYLYLRGNPSGVHAEYWQHTLGCRQWLKLGRDTVTHQVLSVEGPLARPGGDRS
ncbi:MAG: sarcosine oxidase subunit delta [Actinomycetota bacterium]|nr:sarcosine oxidase subunit delta [Actinomycetota bacterium]